MKKRSGIRMALDVSNIKLKYKENRAISSQLKNNSHLLSVRIKILYQTFGDSKSDWSHI